jgi:non-heme chloroperoxidase
MNPSTKNEFVTTDGTIIPYEIKGEGKPIIFIHGLYGKSKDFKEAINTLSQKYCCITYDNRGHGASKETSGLTIKQFAKDLKELIAFLSLENITIVGYSMGAFILFEYIQSFGCEHLAKIVLVDITPKMINDRTWKNGLYRGDYLQEHLDTDLLMIQSHFMKFASYFTYRNMTKFSKEKPYSPKARSLPEHLFQCSQNLRMIANRVQ